MTSRYDVVVVGGGPGGYVAAIRLGQLGRKTLLVERARVGGVCLNWGCIPTKALLYAGHVKRLVARAADFGLTTGPVTVNRDGLVAFTTRVVDRLVRGVESLLRNAGVTVMPGTAVLTGPGRLTIAHGDGREVVEAEATILATGSEPVALPGFDFDGQQVLNSDHALTLATIPAELVIIGAGAIGLEFATIYSRLGAKVRVVELVDQLLPGTDREIATALQRILVRQGIEFFLGARVTGLARTDPLAVAFTHDGTAKTVTGNQVLVAVGRRPLTRGLGLETTSVTLDAHGFIVVDERVRTSEPTIRAIGDVTGPPMLAHRASRQGVVAAESIAGQNTVYEVRAMPACVYTDPEVASVGLSEEAARQQGYELAIGRFPVIAAGRAVTMGENEGLVKVIADARTDALLGLHIVAPGASDLIGEGVLGLEMGASVEDIELSVHPHPTMSEALQEAAAHLHRRAIQIPNR